MLNTNLPQDPSTLHGTAPRHHAAGQQGGRNAYSEWPIDVKGVVRSVFAHFSDKPVWQTKLLIAAI